MMNEWLTKFHETLLGIFGGITNSQHETFRVACRDFVQKKWGQGDVTVMTEEVLRETRSTNCVLVLGDRVVIQNNYFTTAGIAIEVAPWCKDVLISGNICNPKRSSVSDDSSDQQPSHPLDEPLGTPI